MNILFVDIDGVLNSLNTPGIINERMIKVLKKICDIYNCSVVIESTHKPNPYPDEEEYPIIKELYRLCNKYEINILGFTPRVSVHYSDYSTIDYWKDYEILQYLYRNNNIEHIAILDDERYQLELLSDYLVLIKAYNPDNSNEEGLCDKYIEEVGKILKLENRFKR